MLIIVPSPRVDLLFSVLDRIEPVSVQAFLAELSIEGFHDRVVCRLAAAIEVDLHVVRVRPVVHMAACELGSIITGDTSWQTAIVSNLPHGCDHVFSSQTEADFDCQALAGE